MQAQQLTEAMGKLATLQRSARSEEQRRRVQYIKTVDRRLQDKRGKGSAPTLVEPPVPSQQRVIPIPAAAGRAKPKTARAPHK